MATIRPFAALRPRPADAARIAAVPYDVVTTDEAREQAGDNPLSFLRVSRAELELPPGTDPYADAVYERAVQNFERLKKIAFVVEDEPALYLYRLQSGAHEQLGLAASYSLDEYDRDVIKKHERTRKDKEDDRTRHMLELRAQTGVVFLTYRAASAIDALVHRISATAPFEDFVAADGISHTLWRVPVEDEAALVSAFASLQALYIADGHHRAASAARARAEIEKGGRGAGAASQFLAVAFPDRQVQILPYHRVVRSLGGLTAEGFLARLRERMRVREGAAAPAGAGRVSMYLAGQWHEIELPRAPAGTSRADALDVAVLEREILGAVLGIGDIRTDKRIDFVGGGRGTSELERRVDSRDADVAFSLHPVGIDDLMAIADAGGIMPPKSTWFEPKLRDGLLVHLI